MSEVTQKEIEDYDKLCKLIKPFLISGEKLGMQIWMHGNGEPFSFKKIQKITNGSFIKPKRGGIWTSSYTPLDDFLSDWHQWCHCEMQSWIPKNKYLIIPRNDADVFLIKGMNELLFLTRYFSLGSCGSIIYLDFEKMENYFDALSLTEEGQWNTRLTHPSLYGWDSESTLWFSAESIKQVILYDWKMRVKRKMMRVENLLRKKKRGRK